MKWAIPNEALVQFNKKGMEPKGYFSPSSVFKALQ